jgi:hypothetical protein
MSSQHPMHKINGLTFDMNRIDWQSPLLSLEKWRIVNATADFHPMHTHDAQWQVLSRNGNTNIPPVDKGWKDTVLINPAETVEVLVKFTDYKGIYLFHCHNLEHEDDGMMLNFKIIDPIGIQLVSSEIPNEFKLYQNYPNPFNPSTKIKFDVSASGKVKLVIYNSNAKEVITLVNENLSPGTYEVNWNAGSLASGAYFAKLIGSKVSQTVKLLLVK